METEKGFFGGMNPPLGLKKRPQEHLFPGVDVSYFGSPAVHSYRDDSIHYLRSVKGFAPPVIRTSSPFSMKMGRKETGCFRKIIQPQTTSFFNVTGKNDPRMCADETDEIKAGQ
ncbi:MAG: hypothetical protein ABFD44_08525, partial [Anaerolineaceae bacterium]